MRREFRLALAQGSMHMERDFRLALTQESMHALGERVAKARPMPILESNHKTAKPRHVLNG